ncbi:MAG TPA: ABC transporter permease [Vicinamibacterales bacterium]|nr:ABC transporter permease [Vicinamibacterales bacterium]
MRGLWRLTWLEVKIFVREPLGVIGTVVVPALMFIVLGRIVGPPMRRGDRSLPPIVSVDLPILTAMLIAISAVLSLVAVMAIYREGGILKRLRATPLRPVTILTAHVAVKLLFTALSIALMVLGGRRYYPVPADVPLLAFAGGVLVSTLAVLSLGFVLASLAPTARFAQPIGALILYPMLGISGLFAPVDVMSPALQTLSRFVPFTYAVSLLRGLWRGDGWSAHVTDVTALALVFVVCTLVATKAFRWE